VSHFACHRSPNSPQIGHVDWIYCRVILCPAQRVKSFWNAPAERSGDGAFEEPATFGCQFASANPAMGTSQNADCVTGGPATSRLHVLSPPSFAFLSACLVTLAVAGFKKTVPSRLRHDFFAGKTKTVLATEAQRHGDETRSLRQDLQDQRA
jgi:hypothetical protein